MMELQEKSDDHPSHQHLSITECAKSDANHVEIFHWITENVNLFTTLEEKGTPQNH